MIEVKSPTRVDLSGGTLDLWPLFNFVGECQTVNVAIDIWTRVTITEDQTHTKDTQVEIHSMDYDQTWTFKNLEELLLSSDSKLKLYQKVINYFVKSLKINSRISSGFKLTTVSESPIGGGLGGSSSLIISLLKAFSQFYKTSFTDVHDLVRCAHNLEAAILNTPTGTQDYYPAANGGVNIISYDYSKITTEVLNFSNSPLNDNFLLVYTGRSHHSGLNNFEVLKSAVIQDSKVMEALNEIKSISEDLVTALHTQSWNLIPELFKREFKARVQLTPAFTSPEIEKLENIALENGATGVKICGAGGGGCVLIWVDPIHRQNVIEACRKEEFQCLNSKPVAPLI